MAIKFAELINVPIVLKSLDGIHEGRVMVRLDHSEPHSYYVFLTDDCKRIRVTSKGPADKVCLGEYEHQPCLEYIVSQKPTFV